MTIKMLFARFTRTTYIMDLRPAGETRRVRCERFERKNKTSGKPARFV